MKQQAESFVSTTVFEMKFEMQIALPQASPPAPYLPHKGVINLEQKPFLCSSDKSQWNPNVNPDIFYVVKIIFCRLNIWYFPSAL